MQRRLLLKRLMLSLTTVFAVLIALGLAESGARVVNADACDRAAQALPTIEQSLQFLAPDASRDRFLIALAEGYYWARLPEEARRLGALTDHSDDARTWVERGLLWLHLGQRTEASAAFDKAAALSPASHELRLYAEELKSLPAR